jgi:hypothetical protein
MKKSYNIGDVFTVPIDYTHCGAGQIIERYMSTELLFLGIFYWIGISGEIYNIDEMVSESPILAANSFDTLIVSGDWPIIGNTCSQIKRFPLPPYKVLIKGKYYIENWNNDKRRKATDKEIEYIDFRNGVSPIRLEKALKAHNNVAPWHDSFNKMKVSYLSEQAKIKV